MPPPEAVKVLRILSERGLLLKQDQNLPSVVGIVAGEALKTSWWSHPKARRIYAVLSELSDHPDVAFTKLLLGKDTLVHRSLWPALLRVALSREPWQTKTLPAEARRLLAVLDRGDGPVRAKGLVARELQLRLLVHAGEIHTESGRHELALETWGEWARSVGCRPAESTSESREYLERAAAALGAAKSALPWNRTARRT
jgi:hypothetical protein